jgi:hypothetical protein
MNNKFDVRPSAEKMKSAANAPNTKSGKMVNVINYATGLKPTSKYKLPTCKNVDK